MKLPLKYIHVTQGFAEHSPTTLKFYKELGLKSHPGIDFKARIGTNCFSMVEGKVTFSGFDSQGGGCIIIESMMHGCKIVYYHLSGFNCRKGDRVKEGQLIGQTGDTGKYTTGPHLHITYKKVDKYGRTLNYNNGYRGGVDFSGLFDKNWDKCPAYHRYGRKANWFAEWCFRFAPIDVTNRWTKSGHWVQQKRVKLGLHPLMPTRKVNALLYGGWDYDTVNNDGMYFQWGFIKKDEYLRGIRAFLN